MDSGDWRQAKALLAVALERPASERAAFLHAHCADPRLRAEIAALLDAYEHSDLLASMADDDREYTWTNGASVGPYAIAEAIGKGGGGEVYRARDTRLQRDVALKLLPPGAGDEGARRVREARAAAQLNHRGIAAIYDIIESPDGPCIVMEYAPGQTLAERLRERRPDAGAMLHWGREIADAVAHAHGVGIVHCDLKPGNMRFAADGLLKILDFGLARRPAQQPGGPPPGSTPVSGLNASSINGLAIGTPGYMSPEQLLGSAIDCRTDVYSIGIVLYEMAAGEPPFRSSTTNAMSTAIAVLSSPIPELPRDVPRRLRGVIVKCLSRQADQRYADASELRDALDELASPSWRRAKMWFSGS